jgi:hypothetical protein
MLHPALHRQKERRSAMGIGPIVPVPSETQASASSQASLTRRDRELQVEEGQPPIEVPEAELEALHWRKSEELCEKWVKRKAKHHAEPDPDAAEVEITDAENAEPEEIEAEAETEVEAEVREPAHRELSEELPKTEFQEEDSAGTLFDGRS